MLLEKYIFRILLSDNIVSIPDFGVFKATYFSAKIHASTGMAYPPKKTLDFEESPIDGDTVLQKIISKSENISEEEVKIQIHKIVTEWKKNLKNTNLLELEGLGVIIRKGDSKILFTEKKDLNLIPSTFGLKVFPFKSKKKTLNISSDRLKNRISLEKKTSIDELPLKEDNNFENILQDPLEVPKENYDDYYKQIKNNNMRNTILVSIIVSLIILLMVYFILDPFTSDEENLFPDSQTEQSYNTSEHTKNTSTSQERFTEKTDLFDEKEQHLNSEATPIEPKDSGQPLSPFLKDKKYHVIGGSFRFEGNAKRFLRQIKSLGYSSAKNLGKTEEGFYRISYGSFDNKLESQRLLNRIRLNIDQEAWLLTPENSDRL